MRVPRGWRKLFALEVKATYNKGEHPTRPPQRVIRLAKQYSRRKDFHPAVRERAKSLAIVWATRPRAVRK